MPTEKDSKKSDKQLDTYFYPEHQISVQAASQEEADKELKSRLATLKELKAAQADEESE